MHGLSMGNEVLKQLHQEVSLEKVDKLMDETREGVAYQREIDEALMSKMSSEEEEAVQAELEALQREAMVSPPMELMAEYSHQYPKPRRAQRQGWNCQMYPSANPKKTSRRVSHTMIRS